MPTWLIIVIIVLLVLVVGGALARRTQLRRTRESFHRSLKRVNRDLAEAYAQDKGWDRELLESAARRAFAERHGAEPESLELIEVFDRPGTEEDQAVFRAHVGGATQTITLGRRDGQWVSDVL